MARSVMTCDCTLNALTPFDLAYYVGDTVGIKATLTDTAGAAYDLTDCGISFYLVDPVAEDPAARLWDLAIGTGITILDLTGGIALITPTLDQSEALTAGKTYAGRCIVTAADGAIITTAAGYLTTR